MLATALMLQVIGGIQMPPARFDHPYRGRMTIVWTDHPHVVDTCRHALAAGCTTLRSKRRCVIFLNRGYRGTWVQDALMRHERAHCNGWSARHEQ